MVWENRLINEEYAVGNEDRYRKAQGLLREAIVSGKEQFSLERLRRIARSKKHIWERGRKTDWLDVWSYAKKSVVSEYSYAYPAEAPQQGRVDAGFVRRPVVVCQGVNFCIHPHTTGEIAKFVRRHPVKSRVVILMFGQLVSNLLSGTRSIAREGFQEGLERAGGEARHAHRRGERRRERPLPEARPMQDVALPLGCASRNLEDWEEYGVFINVQLKSRGSLQNVLDGEEQWNWVALVAETGILTISPFMQLPEEQIVGSKSNAEKYKSAVQHTFGGNNFEMMTNYTHRGRRACQLVPPGTMIPLAAHATGNLELPDPPLETYVPWRIATPPEDAHGIWNWALARD